MVNIPVNPIPLDAVTVLSAIILLLQPRRRFWSYEN
jgi:hypothetical protein